MKQYSPKQITNAILLALLFFCSAIPPAHPQGFGTIKFNHVFETGGYNFDIAQDQDGFIWVGTINGVKVFNGYDVKSYTAAKETFPTNNIRSVFVDSEGFVWLATFGGLAKYDKTTDTFTTYLHDPEKPNSISSSIFKGSPNLIAESPDGLLWFGTAKGLNSFDKTTELFTAYLNDPEDQNSLSDNDILSVYCDTAGLIWVGTKTGGLNKFDRNTNTFTHFSHTPGNPDISRDIGSGEINVVTEDGDGNLWIGTSTSGLKRFDHKNGLFVHYQHDPGDPDSIAHNNVRVITPGSDGSLWICHPYWVTVGMERFDKEKETFVQYKSDPNYPETTISDSVQVAFEDRSGILWIGENLSTISTYDKQFYKFNLYKPNPNDTNSVMNNVIAVVEDADSEIWLGSGTEGLAKYNRKNDNFTHYPPDPEFPEDKNLTTLFVDSSGQLWINTNNGVLGVIDTKTGKLLRRYHNPKLIEVWSILEDPQVSNILWLGTENNGIFKFDKKTESFTGYEFDDTNKLLLHILGVHADRQKNMWFTNESNGLIRYDRKSDSFKAYRHDDSDPKSISSNNINYFYVGTTGDIWISSQKGLNRFNQNDETFERYGEAAGFGSNVRGILEDEQGFLWISSDSGLLKFDPKTKKVVRRYVEGGRTFNFSPSSVLKTADGEMWFSSSIGVIRFKPRDIKDNPTVPPVYLTSITQGGEKLNRGVAAEKIDRVDLDWQHNFFEFEYIALNFTRADKNQFAYMLEGFDKEWYQAGRHRFGRYSGLPGGRYTLRVKGSNNDGVWNQAGISLEVNVAAPWWETKLFFGSVAGSLIFLIVSVYLLRIRAVNNRNLELEERVKDKTRELQEAFDNIKTLKGLVPICSNCKKIRDDKGFWNRLESYIEEHSDAQFSHGICEECAGQLYGDEEWYKT